MEKNIEKTDMNDDIKTKASFREYLMEEYLGNAIRGSLIITISLLLSIYAGRNIYRFPLIIMYLKIAVIIFFGVFIALAFVQKKKKPILLANFFTATITVAIAFAMAFSIIVSISSPEHTARAAQITMAILIGCVLFAGSIRDRLGTVIFSNLAVFIVIMTAINGLSVVKLFDFYMVIISAISSAVFSRAYSDTLLKEFLLKRELEERLKQLEREIDEKESLQNKLVAMASFDPLTEAYTRRKGIEILKRQFVKCKKENSQLGVCYMDIDNLKDVNDCHGHSAGDRYIMDFILTVKESIRGTDYCIRMGGDEFLLVFPYSEGEAVERVCERIMFNINEKNKANEKSFAMSASHGVVSLAEGEYETVEEMIDEADKLMYKDKMSKSSA